MKFLRIAIDSREKNYVLGVSEEDMDAMEYSLATTSSSSQTVYGAVVDMYMYNIIWKTHILSLCDAI